MRRISKKREEQNKVYRAAKEKLFLNDLKSGKLLCFFSGKPIKIQEEDKYEDSSVLISWLDCHHISGERENNHLFDEEMMVPALRKFHTEYHSLNVGRLLKTTWYHYFLNNLKNKNIDLYFKELYKQVKADILTEEEWQKMKE